jgi:hypothetical protein
MTIRSPDSISVDGIKDPSGLITLWGLATRQPNGKYQCFADVDGMMCIMEISPTILHTGDLNEESPVLRDS